MLMNGEINLLILDEPTNHLDLASREWIENAVEQYDETLIFISHDRYFINKFATRIWAIENGVFTDFNGTYEQWTRKQGDGSFASIETPRKQKNRPPASTETPRKQKNRPPASADKKIKPSERDKELRRVEREVDKLETEIEYLGMKKSEYSTDYEKLMEFDEQEAVLKEQLEELLNEWEHFANL